MKKEEFTTILNDISKYTKDIKTDDKTKKIKKISVLVVSGLILLILIGLLFTILGFIIENIVVISGFIIGIVIGIYGNKFQYEINEQFNHVNEKVGNIGVKIMNIIK